MVLGIRKSLIVIIKPESLQLLGKETITITKVWLCFYDIMCHLVEPRIYVVLDEVDRSSHTVALRCKSAVNLEP